MSDDGPSLSILGGQLEYLFEDEPEARAATDEELAARLSREDRFARAREKYPIESDDEVRAHLDEFDDRISPAMIHEARARLA